MAIATAANGSNLRKSSIVYERAIGSISVFVNVPRNSVRKRRIIKRRRKKI